MLLGRPFCHTTPSAKRLCPCPSALLPLILQAYDGQGISRQSSLLPMPNHELALVGWGIEGGVEYWDWPQQLVRCPPVQY